MTTIIFFALAFVLPSIFTLLWISGVILEGRAWTGCFYSLLIMAFCIVCGFIQDWSFLFPLSMLLLLVGFVLFVLWLSGFFHRGK